MLTTRRGLLMGGVAALAVTAVGGEALASVMTVEPTTIRIRPPMERVWIGWGLDCWHDVLRGEKAADSIVQIKLTVDEYTTAIADTLQLKPDDSMDDYYRKIDLAHSLAKAGAVEILPTPWTSKVRYPEGWYHRDNPQPLIADVTRFRYLHEARGEL